MSLLQIEIIFISVIWLMCDSITLRRVLVGFWFWWFIGLWFGYHAYQGPWDGLRESVGSRQERDLDGRACWKILRDSADCLFVLPLSWAKRCLKPPGFLGTFWIPNETLSKITNMDERKMILWLQVVASDMNITNGDFVRFFSKFVFWVVILALLLILLPY